MSQVAVRSDARPVWPASKTVWLGATGVALGLAFAGLATFHARSATVGMVILVVGAAAIFVRLLGWSVGMIVLLIVTCLIDRNTFPVGGANIRPEQIAGILALATLVVVAVRSRRVFPLVMPNRIELALIAWFVVALISSVVFALSRIESFKILALLMLSSLALFLPRRLIADRSEKIEQVVGWALIAFAIESVYATSMYFVHLLGPTISLSANPATGQLDAYGTLWEPNVLGAMAGAGAVGWAYLGPRYFKHAWIGLAACMTACVASFARAAWLGLIVVMALTLIITPLRKRIDLKSFLFGVVGATILSVWIYTSDRLGDYTPKGSGIAASVGNQTDILGRLYQFPIVFNDLKHRPILGGGIDSYGQRHLFNGVHQHLGNLELLVLNDTGAVGLLVFIVFAVAIVAAVIRFRENPIVQGMAAMIALIAITNQATETLELMITWLLIGLLLAALGAAAHVSSPATAGPARDTGS